MDMYGETCTLALNTVQSGYSHLSLRMAALGENFGAEVAQDVTSLTDAALKRILLCLYGQRFVVLRTAGLTKPQFVEFARRVGDPIRLSGDPGLPGDRPYHQCRDRYQGGQAWCRALAYRPVVPEPGVLDHHVVLGKGTSPRWRDAVLRHGWRLCRAARANEAED